MSATSKKGSLCETMPQVHIPPSLNQHSEPPYMVCSVLYSRESSLKWRSVLI